MASWEDKWPTACPFSPIWPQVPEIILKMKSHKSTCYSQFGTPPTIPRCYPDPGERERLSTVPRKYGSPLSSGGLEQCHQSWRSSRRDRTLRGQESSPYSRENSLWPTEEAVSLFKRDGGGRHNFLGGWLGILASVGNWALETLPKISRRVDYYRMHLGRPKGSRAGEIQKTVPRRPAHPVALSLPLSPFPSQGPPPIIIKNKPLITLLSWMARRKTSTSAHFSSTISRDSSLPFSKSLPKHMAENICN